MSMESKSSGPVRAMWHDTVVAEAPDMTECRVFDGVVYFPKKYIKDQYIVNSNMKMAHGDKGVANYFHIRVGDKTMENGAWTFKTPEKPISHLKNLIGFRKSMKVDDGEKMRQPKMGLPHE
mmetsp:Transcript_16527/g.23122  ORF Transcript_16527/g.23122 Transcript_16527/m.23122 type:complete len:121 (+) Transcript_16527:143-505(+)